MREVAGLADPILFKEASCPTGSPRTYFSQRLAENMTMVVAQQREMGVLFKESVPRQSWQSMPPQTLRAWTKHAPMPLGLVRRSVKGLRVKLETFLEEAEMTDGFPQAPLLQSLREDKLAIRS